MSDDKPEGVDPDVKAKFREALERKQAHAGKDVSDHGVRDKSMHGRDGGASQRMFRRKSGG